MQNNANKSTKTDKSKNKVNNKIKKEIKKDVVKVFKSMPMKVPTSIKGQRTYKGNRRNQNYKPSEIIRMSRELNSSYARSLVFPEHGRDARIPSVYPMPTATFHKHMTVPITASVAGVPVSSTNSGKFCLLFNPYYLKDDTINYSTLLLDNSGLLNGLTPESTTGFIPLAMQLGLPLNVVADYRLVSAAIRITPEMALNSAQGTISCGIYINPSQVNAYAVGVPNFDNVGLTVMSIFDNLMYFNKAQVTALESARLVYFPADPTYSTFIPQGNTHGSQGLTHTDFYFCFFGTGLPSGANLNVEIDLNYEFIPNAISQTFLALDEYKGNEDQQKVIKGLTQKPELISSVGVDIHSKVSDAEEFNFAKTAGGFLKEHGGDIFNVVSTLWSGL